MTRPLTELEAATAQELRGLGFLSFRIAELLDVEERLVLALFRGEAVVGRAEEPVDEPPAIEPVVEDVPPRPSWPPPAYESSQWREFTPRDSRDVVRARLVQLWGRPVWIDDAGDVWCPACLRFRTVADLGAPRNSCPVGIIRRSGTIMLLEPGDDGPQPSQPGRQYLDLTQVQW